MADLLKGINVDEILSKKRSIIVVHGEETINNVLEEIASNKITSAPVINLATKTPIGFVDMLDLVSYALDIVNGDVLKSGSGITTRTQLFGQEKVNKIAGKSWRNVWLPLAKGSSLYDAAKLFKQGSHRVPIVDGNNVIGVVTQSDVIVVLNEHKDKWSQIANTQLKDLGTKIVHKVITVNKNKTAIESFSTFFEKGVNGVAVIDDDGKLISNLSPSDLRGLDGRSFEYLLDSVSDYIKVTRSRKGEAPDKYIGFVKANDTLGHAVQVLIDQHVHRIYVVDDQLHPIGVVSLTDVFDLIMN